MPDFARVMRRYYDFVVRYENVLSDRRMVTATEAAGLAAGRRAGAPASPIGQPGQVWTVARSMPGLRTREPDQPARRQGCELERGQAISATAARSGGGDPCGRAGTWRVRRQPRRRGRGAQ